MIDKLPIIPAVHLETEAEWHRAYSILGFLANGYIWGGDKPAQVCMNPSAMEWLLTISSDYHPQSHILSCKSAITSSFLPYPRTPGSAFGTTSRYSLETL